MSVACVSRAVLVIYWSLTPVPFCLCRCMTLQIRRPVQVQPCQRLAADGSVGGERAGQSDRCQQLEGERPEADCDHRKDPTSLQVKRKALRGSRTD